MKFRSLFLLYPLFALCFGVIQTSSVGAQDLKQPIQTALDQADTARAIAALNTDIELDPGYYYNYHILGMIHYNRSQYEQAVEQFETALKKKKKHYLSLYYLGLSQMTLGNLDEALESMEQGVKKARNEKAMFENGYGLVKLKQEDYQEADRAFRRALAIDENNAEYHINLGDANFYQGIPALAVTEYEKALAVATGSLEVYFHWAEACLEMKDYACAIEKLRIVLTKDSLHAPAWKNAGGIYFKAARSLTSRDDRNSRFRDAIGSYKRYLELSGAKPDSSEVRVLFELAMSYVSLYGFEDAVTYFEQVLAIPYEPRDVYFYYGKCLWGTKDYVKAGEMFLKHMEWVTAQPDEFQSSVRDGELFKLLGDSYYYRKPNDFRNAIQWYRRSLDERPEQERLVHNIAVAYHSLKDYVNAIDYYQQRMVFGIDSSTAGVIKNAGYCAMNIANASAGAADDGMDDLDEEEDEGTGSSVGAVDPNVNYYQVGVDFLIQYLEHDPTDSKVTLMVANTYLYQLADCVNGKTWFEKLGVLEPDNCEVHKSLGYAYFGAPTCNKNYTKALWHLNEAYRCLSKGEGGGCADADMVLWIAQCYHLRGADKAKAKGDPKPDFENAYNWYGKVLKCNPSNAVAKKGQNDLQFEY